MTPYDFTIKKVREAGEKILELRTKNFEVTTKDGDPRDIVTSIDIEINNFLVDAIKKAFPDHKIYSEESGGTIAGKNLWVIDPIDGSSNFSRNIPHFAVCLGLIEDGIPITGAVYNPVTNELFSFKKGGGAFLNGLPIHVSKVEDLSQSGVFLHAGRKPEFWDWGGESYKKLLAKALKTANFGSSALDICFVAAGRIEANIYGRLTTIDIAPAIGILIEAGGSAVNKDWEPITLSTEPQKFVAANNEKILGALREFI